MKYINQEITYGIKSKIYLIITLLLVTLYGIVLFMNYNSVTDTYNTYLRYVDYYEKNNLDIETDLNGDYKIEKSGNNINITNPILYTKESLSKYIYAASPKYTLSQLLESSILFFPLVFGILGLVIATNDYKYRTIKLRTIRISRFKFGMVKQLSIIFSSFIMIAISLSIAYILGDKL